MKLSLMGMAIGDRKIELILFVKISSDIFSKFFIAIPSKGSTLI